VAATKVVGATENGAVVGGALAKAGLAVPASRSHESLQTGRKEIDALLLGGAPTPLLWPPASCGVFTGVGGFGLLVGVGENVI
jgi:hypothetical protein